MANRGSKPNNNKRKRGKRKSTKKYYKPVYKGIRYITNALLKKYPKRYKSRSEASAEANRLLSILKESNTKVTKSNAISILIKERKARRVYKETELPDSMTEVFPYYELDYLLKEIALLPEQPKITFTSMLVPQGLPDMLAGKEYSYSTYFRDYVNYIDTLREQSEVDYYDQEWFVRCTKPKKTKIHADTFYSRIIACDAYGNEQSDSYGFDPSEVNTMPTNGFVPSEGKEYPLGGKSTNEEEGGGGKSVSDIDKQIELKKLENESDRLKIEKAKELRALLDAKVPYEEAKKILGL